MVDSNLNADLIERFAECEGLGDPLAWDELGMQYFNRGYVLNAGKCFDNADKARRQAIESRFHFEINAHEFRAEGRDGGMAEVLVGVVGPVGEDGFVALLGEGWCMGQGKSAEDAIVSALYAFERLGQGVR